MSFMSFQNIKKALFVGTIALLNFNAQAQIEKGVSTLGGGFNTTIAKSGTSTNLSPSYRRFITNRIMVGFKLDVLAYKSNALNYKYANYDFTPELRYYFNPQSTWKFFGGASVGLRTLSISYESPISSKFTNHDFHQSVYVGFNKFLNKDIAIEGTLGINHSNVMLEPATLTTSTYRLTNVYTTGLNLSINHFTNFKSSDTDFEGLTDKGRTIIGGKLSLNRYSGTGIDANSNFQPLKRRGNYAILSAEYGKFVAKGLLIGVKTNVILSNQTKLLGITPYVQYYYPVSNRFLLHAKAELEYNFTKNNNYGTFRGGLGATYFLSRNVALNFDVLNFNRYFNSTFPTTSNNKAINSNVGLRFLLK
jgi:hypothetical protein